MIKFHLEASKHARAEPKPWGYRKPRIPRAVGTMTAPNSKRSVLIYIRSGRLRLMLRCLLRLPFPSRLLLTWALISASEEATHSELFYDLFFAANLTDLLRFTMSLMATSSRRTSAISACCGS